MLSVETGTEVYKSSQEEKEVTADTCARVGNKLLVASGNKILVYCIFVSGLKQIAFR